MNRTTPAFAVLIAFSGCVYDTDSAGSAESALGYTSGPPSPEAPDVEDCWFVDPDDIRECRPNRCSGYSGPVPDQPPSSFAAPTSPRKKAASRHAIDDFIPPPECPTPSGIVACPHCNRIDAFQTDFEVQWEPSSQFGSRAMLANGFGDYAIIDIPIWNGGTPQDGRRRLAFDLKNDVDVIYTSGHVDLDDTVYMLFSTVADGKMTPVQQWVECPIGGDCVPAPAGF
ncbi:MAG: hypothetical protein AAGE52_19595 [Myxococcota bacterium]